MVGKTFRDHNEDWLLGFMANLGRCDVVFVNFWAICQGLLLAWHNEWRHVIVESDSTLATSMMKRIDLNINSHLSLLSAIKSLSVRSWQVEFKHTNRETNKVANFLSKEARERTNGVRLLNVPPSEVITHIEFEKRGTLTA